MRAAVIQLRRQAPEPIGGGSPSREAAESRVFAFSNTVVLALAIVVAGVIAYHNSFQGALVLDDHPTIEHNPSIRSLWTWKVLQPPASVGTAGRPAANLTFALNYALTSERLAGYHAVNLLVHLATALLLAGIVRRILALSRFRAFSSHATVLAALVGLLWVVHPLTTEAVTYLSQRTEALAACGMAATVYCTVRLATTGQKRWWGAGAIACALAMASKETAVAAPIVAFTVDAAFVGGTVAAAWRQRRGWYVTLAACWLVLAALLVSARLGARGVGLGHGSGTAAYALTECRALATYLKLAVWPQPLVFDYAWATPGSLPIALTRATLVLTALTAIATAAIRGWRGAWLGILWLLLLAPTSSVVPIADQPIAESRTYLPLAAVVVAGVAGGYLLLGRRVFPAAVFAVVPLTFATLHRNDTYRTEARLWADVLQHHPDNPRALNALGLLAAKSGDLPRAIELHERAVAVRPIYAEAQGNLGVELLHAHRPAEALAHFRRAVELAPNLFGIHANLASALLATGDTTAGIAELRLALQRTPDNPQLHQALALALAKTGAQAEALAEFQTAAQLTHPAQSAPPSGAAR